ncbi:hypothetical protein X797_002720 [Metarhizium robertsii]|uniref:Uncharacterized protein n=1 Tax=Metarhizium robertsii TaxID=568076 RepID=A0A0A1V667_9HYPO|nr:hypothetical protein X797_002720 [Metarhizium robertsii]
MSDRDNWGDLWEEPHEHAQPGDEGCGFGPSDDEDDPGHLLECCNEQRPQAPRPMVCQCLCQGLRRKGQYRERKLKA